MSDDTFLEENLHKQLDLRLALRDLQQRTRAWLQNAIEAAVAGHNRLGGVERVRMGRYATSTCFWATCSARGSSQVDSIALGIQLDVNDAADGATGAYACVWLAPTGSQGVTEFRKRVRALARPDIVGAHPKQDGTVWGDGGSVGLALAEERSGWPSLEDLESDLQRLAQEAVRLVEVLEQPSREPVPV